MSNDSSDLVTLGNPIFHTTYTREDLGNKGFILNEMIRELGLPVPPGFIVPTKLCEATLRNGWPDYLSQQIEAKLQELEATTGQSFGDPTSPLIVSVRSGAAVSMPGMMDTILNVGLTPELVEAIGQRTGDPLFAADTWLRFVDSYATSVLEIDREILVRWSPRNYSVDGTRRAAENIWKYAQDNFEIGIPDDPFIQIIEAIKAVFRSWESKRAITFRRKENLPDAIGTAAIIQKMVFGNLNSDSGTGVVFSRHPVTGVNQPLGDYIVRGQGEDVVAGGTMVSSLEALRDQNSMVYSELLEILRMLEHHYRDMCDVEFTVENGKLYILQNRVGKRTAWAAIKIAVDMASDDDFPLEKSEAIGRVSEEQIQEVRRIRRIVTDDKPLATGLAASSGIGSGELCLSIEKAIQCDKENRPFILVRQETSPDDIPGMIGASGVITMLGGMTSHAAVVARSWGIPAVTSLQNATLTKGSVVLSSVTLAEGTIVTVDGTSGNIFLGNVPTTGNEVLSELQIFLEWRAVRDAGAPERTDLFELDASQESVIAVLKIVKLKGICNPEQISRALLVSEEDSNKIILDCTNFLDKIGESFALTDLGRELLTSDLLNKRLLANTENLRELHTEFIELDTGFKSLVTDWQTTSTDSSELTDVMFALKDLTFEISTVLKVLEKIDISFRRYLPLFEIAVGEIREGDSSMIASPLKDSYHTVWFELHQELIDLSGLSRINIEQ